MGKLKSAAFLWVGLLVGLLLYFLFLYNHQKNSPNLTARQLPPTVGAPVPDFSLAVIDGTQVKFSTLKGKPVLINFWATWCPPCNQEMPLLERYANHYKGRLIVLGIDYQEDPEIVQSFVKEKGISFPILLDHTGSVAELFFARDFPTSFFVDSNGILRGQHLGVLDEDLLVRLLKTIGLEP